MLVYFYFFFEEGRGCLVFLQLGLNNKTGRKKKEQKERNGPKKHLILAKLYVKSTANRTEITLHL